MKFIKMDQNVYKIYEGDGFINIVVSNYGDIIGDCQKDEKIVIMNGGVSYIAKATNTYLTFPIDNIDDMPSWNQSSEKFSTAFDPDNKTRFRRFQIIKKFNNKDLYEDVNKIGEASYRENVFLKQGVRV